MKIDKEYPATHSMSTAWYLVDDDDNVAIMQFDDNGPIPVGVPQNGNFADSILFGEVFREDESCGEIELSEAQLDELLGEPHDPKQSFSWFEVVVKIDTTKEEEFMRIVGESEIDLEGTISQKLGLYRIYPYKDVEDDCETIRAGSSLELLIQSGIIIGVYSAPNLWMECSCSFEHKELTFTKSFEHAPYYLYLQPYWTEFLQKRMHVPQHPVKLSQISVPHRHKALRIPGRFDEMDRIQIAKWYPSFLSYEPKDAIVDGGYYALLPIEGGGDIYVLSSFWQYDYLDYCPYRKREGCTDRFCQKCVSTFSIDNVLSPVVFYILDPRICFSDWPQEPRFRGFRDKAVAFSYIPKYPQMGNEEHSRWIEGVKHQISDAVLREVFQQSHAWFEHLIAEVRPRVFIIDDEAREIFESVFPIKDQSVEIGKETYPIFLLSELESCRGQIEELVAMPYRGRVFQHSYSIEEMEELKKKGIAQ